MPPSAGDIKKTIRGLVYRCPLGTPVQGCPFTLLGLLSYESREAVLRRMTTDECVRLFELTPNCQCPADPRHCEAKQLKN
ncbi:MAG TPA: hypothetical protein VHD62_17465 [Opitutaceae bacterium]|nr:hypothetical protein [Opitutaceae bacterium]